MAGAWPSRKKWAEIGGVKRFPFKIECFGAL